MNKLQHPTGIIVVDHGSRRQESNAALLTIVSRFAQSGPFKIVEPAHMELAEPTISTSFNRCVEQGAKRVIIHPFFLLPGRHWHDDIPTLAAKAAEKHPDIPYLVTAPVGLDERLIDAMHHTIEQCWNHASGKIDPCKACETTTPCGFVGQK